MTTLLVASTGGHLKQLHRLQARLPPLGPTVWATFDTAQSRSLLEDQQVVFVPFVGGRDPANIMRNLPVAARIFKEHPVARVVSTGSSVAIPYFAVARLRGIESHYVESAARSEGPSVTGRVIARIPGVRLYTQYPGWAEGRWHYSGSVFDSFERSSEAHRRPTDLKRVVVSLGTYRGFSFERLVQRLLQVLPSTADVLWQTGDTDVSAMGIDGRFAIPEKELTKAIREADVVVAHAGVGTALAALEAGKCPVLVPRRVARREHIDDHQIQIASELARRGLAVSVDADDLSLDELLDAASAQIIVNDDDRPILAR